MKAINKQILEAINRGVNLALDDFEDFDDSASNKQEIISVDPKEMHIRIQYNRLIQTLEKEALNGNWKNRQDATLTPYDIHLISIYARCLKIKYPIKNEKHLLEIIRYIVGEHIESNTTTETFIKGIDNFAELNWLDVSRVEKMNALFANMQFYGDISKWNVGNVKEMYGMFYNSTFNGDISNWNVSNVETMKQMFEYNRNFNCDISKWDVSNVEDMEMTFLHADSFNQDISNWDVSKVIDRRMVFSYCPIKEEYKPTFTRQ